MINILRLHVQNLRDQAARFEKSLGDAVGNISSKVGNRRQNAEERNEVANQEEQVTDLYSKYDQNTNPLGSVNTQQTQVRHVCF